MSKEKPESPEEIYDYFIDYMQQVACRPERGWPQWTDEQCIDESEAMFDFYQSKQSKTGGWLVGKNKMRDWKAAARNWYRNWRRFNNQKKSNGTSHYRDKLEQAYRNYDYGRIEH